MLKKIVFSARDILETFSVDNKLLLLVGSFKTSNNQIGDIDFSQTRVIPAMTVKLKRIVLN